MDEGLVKLLVQKCPDLKLQEALTQFARCQTPFLFDGDTLEWEPYGAAFRKSIDAQFPGAVHWDTFPVVKIGYDPNMCFRLRPRSIMSDAIFFVNPVVLTYLIG